MKSRKSALRTVDVARQTSYSVQQIRVLENDGVLPPAARSASGYRAYAQAHVQAGLAYRALATAVGPAEAKQLMRAVHHEPVPRLLALLDTAHARLHAERAELALAIRAAAEIAAEPLDDVRPTDSMSISELAGALGLRPSTLRHWENEGLLAPAKTAGQRSYTPGDVRDARIVHQLRQAGYRIPALQALMPQLRHAKGWPELTAALAAREEAVNTRSRQLVAAAAALHPLLPTTC